MQLLSRWELGISRRQNSPHQHPSQSSELKVAGNQRRAVRHSPLSSSPLRRPRYRTGPGPADVRILASKGSQPASFLLAELPPLDTGMKAAAPSKVNLARRR